MQESASEPGLAALPKTELVYRSLRDHIVRKVFRDGLILRQGQISETFGVGRGPVADALRRLEDEGLIRKRVGHGFLVANGKGNGDVEPAEMDLADAGLEVPKGLRNALSLRRLKSHIYPKVEQAVASIQVFGRFRINQSALAEHYGVSRTIAHEILAELESVGLVTLGSNGRWYAGPLTYENIAEFYELRWILEPVALRQAASAIKIGELRRLREYLDAVLKRGLFEPEEMGRVETELHQDLVLRCANEQMRKVLIRCQLPIISTFDTVERNLGLRPQGSGLREAVMDHAAVVDCLINGDSEGAAVALERHLRRAFELCAPHFKDQKVLPAAKTPPYIVSDPQPVGDRNDAADAPLTMVVK